MRRWRPEIKSTPKGMSDKWDMLKIRGMTSDGCLTQRLNATRSNSQSDEWCSFYGVLVKQYHASLSNLRSEGGTRMPRHLSRVSCNVCKFVYS